MPATAKPKIDWDVAKMLYLQGLSAPEIAQKIGCKVGTLRANRKRHGWAISKAKLNEVTTPANTGVSKPSVDEIGETVKYKLAKDMEAQVALLEKHPPCTIKELPGKYGRTSTAATLAAAAAKVFGWDQQMGRAVINIGTLNQLKLDGSVSECSENVVIPGSDKSQTIDIESSS